MEYLNHFEVPFFKLNGKMPVKVNMSELVAFIEDGFGYKRKHIVKQSHFTGYIMLSTVFLTTPANGFHFETMVLGLPTGAELIDRCNSYDMALKLHDQFRRIMIDKLKHRFDYSLQFNSVYGNTI